jgi:hypothetical protein
VSHAGKDPEIVSGGTVSEVGRGLDQRAAAVRASHRSPYLDTRWDSVFDFIVQIGVMVGNGSGASTANSPCSAADAPPVTLVSDWKLLEIRHVCFAACRSSVRQPVFSGPKSPDAPEP